MRGKACLEVMIGYRPVLQVGCNEELRGRIGDHRAVVDDRGGERWINDLSYELIDFKDLP